MSEIYNFEVNDIDQVKIKLDEYKGKTILIVNVASACGFTPQYEGLQSMYKNIRIKALKYLLSLVTNLEDKSLERMKK